MEYTTPYRSIVLMGQTGCGKGTQAAKIAEAFNYKIFSTGDKTREYAAQDTPLGQHIAKVHTIGWIPEWLASYVMTKAILEEFFDDGLVFESVARKPEEANKLHEIHAAIERPYIVLYLDCDVKVVRERQLKRGREGYDNPENVAKRMEAFENETTKSISFFEEQGVLRTVNADQPIDDVFNEIVEILK